MRVKLLLTSIFTVAGASMLVVAPEIHASSSTQSTIKEGNIYQVRNLTKGTDFKSTTSADKCDELQFRVRIQNTGSKNSLNNVSIRTAGSSSSSNTHTSTVTVKATNAHAKSVTDTATVKLADSSKLTYVSGSSQLLNPSGKALHTVNGMSRDTGVMIDSIGPVKERRYVQFKVRVDCSPKPSEPSRPSEEKPSTSRPSVEEKAVCTELKVVAIDRTRHTVTAVTNTQHSSSNASYVFTVKRQDGSTVDTKTVTAQSGSAQYQFDQLTPGVYTVSAKTNTETETTDSAVCTRQITVQKEAQPKEEQSGAPVVPDEPESTPPATPAPSSNEPVDMGGSEIKASDEDTPAPTPPSEPTEKTETLPATGTAGVAGVFVGVSALSSIVYYVVTRKFSV